MKRSSVYETDNGVLMVRLNTCESGLAYATMVSPSSSVNINQALIPEVIDILKDICNVYELGKSNLPDATAQE